MQSMGLDYCIIHTSDFISQPITEGENNPFYDILERVIRSGELRREGVKYYLENNKLHMLEKIVVFLEPAKNIDNYDFIKSKVKSADATPKNPLVIYHTSFCIFQNRLYTLHHSLAENKLTKSSVYEGYSEKITKKMEDAKNLVEELYEKERLSEKNS